ncbi:MAG TPA: AAA family ATPase, partial [Candidatus Limnocylindrales bacterium]
MGRPRFTYAEALRILARGDARITKLDSALGGIILGAAPFTGGAALALLDAKSEAIKLLRELTDTAPARIKAAKGKAHYELLEAAHAVLALTAFFGAFRDTIGPRFRDLELTHDDLEALDRQPVPPMPSAIRGFSENLVEVAGYFEVLFSLTLALVEGLAAWEQVGWADRMMLRREVVGKAQHYYHDHYVRLAADLPEFAFWTWMQEHAATRSALRELHDLLASTIKATGQTGDVERKLARRAGEVLEKPLWRTDSPVSGIAFPSVAEGFVSPRFRVTVADKASRPADETWWLDQPTAQDLGSFLTVQLTHPDSARHPLIILGHPGAGKTLMAEVLAARLPAESYTPILVRLRRVDADAELHRQLETALESTVRERVSWGQLCRENKATKVLILDGFDELIQATGVAQSGYLEQIAEFQQEAWRDGHSVIAIITSRTLVMDRARVPEGCTLVKLEDFDDTQLESWLEAWNGANRAIQGFRPLTVTELLRHGDLARQPLLTVLLAIYAADTVIDGAEAKALSRCELYKRLLDSFVARQIRD